MIPFLLGCLSILTIVTMYMILICMVGAVIGLALAVILSGLNWCWERITGAL